MKRWLPRSLFSRMKRLQDSAQRLRESIQAMAQHSPGADRDKAIKDAQQALYDTNEAMIQLPPDMCKSRHHGPSGARLHHEYPMRTC